jgi:hypothetical protein
MSETEELWGQIHAEFAVVADDPEWQRECAELDQVQDLIEDDDEAV